MKVISILLAIVALSPLPVEETFTDPRDGEVYEIATIGDLKWFAENLRHKTPDSWCATENKGCEGGNFYLFTDRDKACPPGWRIPTDNEWESTFQYICEESGLDHKKVSYAYGMGENHFVEVRDTSLTLALLKGGHSLKFMPTGWVQGKKHKRNGSYTIWVSNDSLETIESDYYHIHFGDYGFNKHTHSFHVNEKPRKNRRFTIRCVCEAD